MTDRWLLYTIGLGFLGLVYGCGVAAAAFRLVGGGHGWVSAGFSAVGVLLVPAFGVALASPRGSRRPLLAWVATATLLTDLLLIFATWNEGVPYLVKVWSAAPSGVVLWAFLWIAWQLAAAGVLMLEVLAARRA
ncbi:hypothetical protein [Paludisphaera mucosa]|uniref:Uncharacterized protein n=1 Tax=Paludisphaera mucosa TaxID=3030827 RepID=A0ABT6FHE1_9BACT|nr:hypothetical protein [Paludisphaera mucosa]MDG3006997.1 hypothetical protein [Paludisphaera mucosa]